jgi:hypothetical protein
MLYKEALQEEYKDQSKDTTLTTVVATPKNLMKGRVNNPGPYALISHQRISSKN